MPNLSSVSSIWNNIKEMDLRPLRQEALRTMKIALVGAPQDACETLAANMRHDPARPGAETDTPLLILSPAESQPAAEADLIVLLIDPQALDFSQEKALVQGWAGADKKVIVIVNRSATAGGTPARGPWVDWGQRRVLYGSVDDTRFLTDEFVPAVMELMSDHLLPLARSFPLFRVPIARHLINDSSFSNATYALSTGLAEVVPVFDIPLNMADMVVLTKTQAFLVYKLGMALGHSTRWQDYVTEFSSVLGSGFVWRQAARGLIGLIPAWGIIPKVAISYAGTYVVGNVVLQWYLTGRHVTREQMRELYGQAFARGQLFARNLANKMPKPKLKIALPRLGRRKPAELPEPRLKICPHCGRENSMEASYCQYCGSSLSSAATPEESSSDLPPEASTSQPGEDTGQAA